VAYLLQIAEMTIFQDDIKLAILESFSTSTKQVQKVLKKDKITQETTEVPRLELKLENFNFETIHAVGTKIIEHSEYALQAREYKAEQHFFLLLHTKVLQWFMHKALILNLTGWFPIWPKILSSLIRARRRSISAGNLSVLIATVVTLSPGMIP
jgi:hypothetical protein